MRKAVTSFQSPADFKTKTPTAITTTTLRIVLMLEAIGIKRLTNHSATPTTTNMTTKLSKGIPEYSSKKGGQSAAQPNAARNNALPEPAQALKERRFSH